MSQRGRVERLAGVLFTCCKISQEVSAIVQAFVVIGTLPLKVSTPSQRTTSFA